MTVDKSPDNEAQFGSEVLEVCQLLEQWQREEKLLTKLDPNELPETNWRVMAQALFFLGAGGLVVLVQSWLRFMQDSWTLALFHILVAICGGTGMVLVLHAQGLFAGRFWSAMRRSFTQRGTYPFTPLIYRAERDVAALPKLGRFSDDALKATAERLSCSESRFRDGLTLLGGDSSLPTLAALVAGAWGAWKSHWGEVSALSMATLAGAIGVVWLAAYTFTLRFSLLELARCRDFIALELARRQATGARRPVSSATPNEAVEQRKVAVELRA